MKMHVRKARSIVKDVYGKLPEHLKLVTIDLEAMVILHGVVAIVVFILG